MTRRMVVLTALALTAPAIGVQVAAGAQEKGAPISPARLAASSVH